MKWESREPSSSPSHATLLVVWLWLWPPMSCNYISSQRGQWYSSIWGHRERDRHGPQDSPILHSTNSNTGGPLGGQKWAAWWAKNLQQNVKLFQQKQRPGLWEIQAASVQILLSHLLGWRAYAIALISLHFCFLLCQTVIHTNAHFPELLGRLNTLIHVKCLKQGLIYHKCW